MPGHLDAETKLDSERPLSITVAVLHVAHNYHAPCHLLDSFIFFIRFLRLLHHCTRVLWRAGLIKTPAIEDMAAKMGMTFEGVLAHMGANHAMGRCGKPEEVRIPPCP